MDNLLPGQMVSAYNYTKGKSDQSEMFSGGYVFIDHASGYVSIKHQVAINATEIVKEKLTFEREDKIQGVMINVYHTDNLNLQYLKVYGGAFEEASKDTV